MSCDGGGEIRLAERAGARESRSSTVRFGEMSLLLLGVCRWQVTKNRCHLCASDLICKSNRGVYQLLQPISWSGSDPPFHKSRAAIMQDICRLIYLSGYC
jgi:hypothetical protein